MPAPRPLGLFVLAAIGLASHAVAGVCPPGIDELSVSAAHFQLLTSPAVLNHLPGPTPQEMGDGLIGTADDGVRATPSVFGAPNDLGRENTGLPGSTGTKPLHGTSVWDSHESDPHAPDSDELRLARPGEGAFSYMKFRMGQFETLSYLAGGVSGLPDSLRGGMMPLYIVQATLAGTTLVPDVLFQGPFNIDLITVSPGEDRDFGTRDDAGETVARGCNGLAPGVDEVTDWFPLNPEQYPKHPRTGFGGTNRGEWNPRSAKEREPDGRRISGVADVLFKVPTSALFFVAQDMPLVGYGFPRGEAGGLLNPRFHPDGNLPDIPGFPGSGQGLARYIHDVLVPIAEQRDELLIGFLRGADTLEIVGVPVTLDFTFVATGSIGTFDICTLDVTPCN
jgi:hypothetical protein